MLKRFVIFVLLLLAATSFASAQHSRLYAVVLANDNPTNFMGASSKGSGLFRSDDTGRTWQQLGWDHIKAFSMDAVDTSNGEVLYLAAGNGILRSTDAGLSWKLITDWRMAEVLDVAVDQKHPYNLYAATAFGIWRSSDAGSHWLRSYPTIPTPYCSRIRVARENSDQIVIAAETGVFRSRDRGKTWRRIVGSPRAVRDLQQLDDGSWLFTSAHEGVFLFDQDLRLSRMIRPSSSKELWSSAKIAAGFLIGGYEGVQSVVAVDSVSPWETPPLVNSIASIGNARFYATLEDGVWVSRDSTSPAAVIGLKDSQVWTLRVFTVQ